MRHAKSFPRGGDPAERALVGPLQIELDYHAGVGVMKGDQLVALIGKGGPRVLEVLAHRVLPVEDIARRHDLVAGVAEGAQRQLEVVVVLGLHVLPDERLATLAQVLTGRHIDAALLGTTTTGRRSNSSAVRAKCNIYCVCQQTS